eukprot:scaffold11621_cov67-Phaeocystis_antarctica.AAC.2
MEVRSHTLASTPTIAHTGQFQTVPSGRLHVQPVPRRYHRLARATAVELWTEHAQKGRSPSPLSPLPPVNNGGSTGHRAIADAHVAPTCDETLIRMAFACLPQGAPDACMRRHAHHPLGRVIEQGPSNSIALLKCVPQSVHALSRTMSSSPAPTGPRRRRKRPRRLRARPTPIPKSPRLR